MSDLNEITNHHRHHNRNSPDEILTYDTNNNNNINSIEDYKSIDTEYLNPPDDRGRLTPYLAFCLIICSIGCSLQVGWNIGIYNTPVKVFKEFFNETYVYKNNEVMSDKAWTRLWSLTNGLMPLGGMIGGLASGNLADLYGRKKIILIINGVVIVSGTLTVISKIVKSYVPFIFGRFLTGVYCGLFTGVGPLYLTEVAPKNLRGAAGACNQLAIVIGILLTNVMGLPQIFGTLELWPYLIAATLIPTLVHFIFFPFCVETPKYIYINRDDPQKAEKIIRKLRGADEELINEELNELAAEKNLRSKQNKVTYKDLIKRPSLRRPLILTIVIQISQQFSGINSIAYYSTNMFISIGLDAKTWAVYATIIIDIFKVTITIICMILIERAGRRKLLLIGLSGMSFFSFTLAIFPAISNTQEWIKYLTVASAIAYVIAFSIGPGSIPWLITSELFASDSRGKATSVAVLVNWLSNFIVTTSIPLVMAEINNYIYIIFGIFILIFIAFIYLKVPETKKKSIDEISKHFIH